MRKSTQPDKNVSEGAANTAAESKAAAAPSEAEAKAEASTECDGHCEEAVVLPDDEVLYELADLFKLFGDSTRIKILYALHDNEMCVQCLADTVQMSQSAVSHQLRVLKDSKLVRFRREGKTVYYALDDDHVRSILSMGMEHIEE